MSPRRTVFFILQAIRRQLVRAPKSWSRGEKNGVRHTIAGVYGCCYSIHESLCHRPCFAHFPSLRGVTYTSQYILEGRPNIGLCTF